MAIVIKMPKLGATMKEGTLEVWRVKEGDFVNEGDVLCEIATDKLTNEIETDEEGIVRKILVEEDSTVPCQTPLAIIAGAEEDISALI